MKNETNKNTKVSLKGFFTALLVSLAMIGAACAYAYQASSTAIQKNLSSLQKNLSAEVTGTSATAGLKPQQQTQAMTVTEAEKEVYDAVADVLPTDSPDETEPPADETEPPSEAATEAVPDGEYDHVLVMPLEGEVQQEFSCGELVKSPTTGTWQTHNGADISAEEGSAVCAIDNGTVTEIVKDALWGVCVTIDHGNGISSRYCGLSPSLAVKEGDTVESGQNIGSVGNTADIESRQEPHLHLEVIKNDIYVDPLEYINSSEN